MKLLRFVGPGAVAFLALWLGFLLVGRAGFFHDPGTFWHTVVGQRMLTDGFFDTDPFTFTFGGAKWIPHQWLGEVGMALAHSVGGFDTLLLGTATLLAAVFAWPAARFARTGLHPVAVGAVVLAAVAAGASHFHARPHLATIAGMAVTLIFLVDVDHGRRRLNHLFWLVPVYLVWANCHGGMLGGLVTLALTAGGWMLARLLGWPSPVQGWRDVATLAAVGVACGLTAFVNPYGLELPRAWLAIMDSPVLPVIIQEHSRLDLTSPTAWPVLLFAAVYLFVLAGVLPQRPRVSWLLPLFWLAEAFSRVRHAPLFAVTGLVAVAAMWPHTRWAALLAAKRPDFQCPAGPPLRFWPNVALPTACVLLVLGLQATHVVGGWVTLDPVKWPVELTDTLRANEPHSPREGNRLFNEYIDGGFVTYHAPGYRVFIDDRCELFGDQWLLAFLKAEAEGTADAVAGWERRYDRFDFALTRADSGFEAYFRDRPEWICVKRTAGGAFYRRKL